MGQVKETAATPTKTEATVQETNQTVTQPKTKGKTGKKSKKGEEYDYNMRSSVYAIAFKLYAEQLPDGGFEKLKQRILAYPKEECGPNGKPIQPLIIEAIIHDRDVVGDDFWEPATEKPHVHILVRCVYRKQRIHISTICSILGIVFRKRIDDDMIKHHGIDAIRDFSAYTLYLTHETEKAMLAGKELYDVSEIFTNLSSEELQNIRDGYTKLHLGSSHVDFNKLCELDKEAYELGKRLGDFQAWARSQDFAVRSHAKFKTIRESYNQGLAERLEDRASLAILRTSIFIQGESNLGKTYGAVHALKNAFGLTRILDTSGQKTGRYDALNASTQAIVINDDAIDDPLQMADNFIYCRYRRNSDNRPWVGQYFIVTSNKTFEQWTSECGIKVKNGYGQFTEEYLAVRSRFYVCSTDDAGHLYCESVSTRGEAKEREIRHAKFKKFRDEFEKLTTSYCKSKKANTVDDSVALGYSASARKELEDATTKTANVYDFKPVPQNASKEKARANVLQQVQNFLPIDDEDLPFPMDKTPPLAIPDDVDDSNLDGFDFQ